MNFEPQTYEELIRMKRCVELTKYLLPQPQRQSHDPGQRDPRDQMPQMRCQY